MSCVPWSNESERADYWKSAWSTERAENERLQEELKIYRGFPNEPLTLDELRGMDGEPVWIVAHPDWGHWELSEDAEDYLADRDPDFYGMKMRNDPAGRYGLHVLDWLAYRRPPERSNNEQQV